MEAPKIGLVRCHCQFCGKDFWSKSSWAGYCSSSCKQKMYRWRKKLENQEDKALDAVRNIASYFAYEKSTPSAVTALNRIIAECFLLMNKNNIQRVK